MEIIEIKKDMKGVLVEYKYFKGAGDFGTAITLHFGKPYLGMFGRKTPVHTQRPRSYLQVWDTAWNGRRWECRAASYKGNNYVADPDEFEDAVEFGLENGLKFK